jgi:hypothetical protein
MPVGEKYRLKLGESLKAARLPALAQRRVERAAPPRPAIGAAAVVRALRATAGAGAVIARIPKLVDVASYLPVATFSVCMKTGTARWLDIWDADHFDGFTDMQRCLADCRAWFSAEGYATWDAPQTKTGRVNCYFRAPSAGTYVCTAHLQSYGGSAVVECLIDAFSFGPLPFSGAVSQPHPCTLSAGYHHFRIRQLNGSFFFNGLTVWRV